MARRKYEFRPDKVKTDFLGKIYLTPQQRKNLLRWLLFSLLLLVVSVAQDVLFCKLEFLGATTDLVPCLIIVICIRVGADRGAVFTLIASMLYKFSGSAPGYYSMALIPVLALIAAMLRQNYFRRSFGSVFLCATLAMVAYEMCVFLFGLVFANTAPQRAIRFLLTGIFSVLSLPILYPITRAIDKIGEKTWKD